MAWVIQVALTAFLCPCWSEEQGDTPHPTHLDIGVTGRMQRLEWYCQQRWLEPPRAAVLHTALASAIPRAATQVCQAHGTGAKLGCSAFPSHLPPSLSSQGLF